SSATRGRYILKVVPWPSSLYTQMYPPSTLCCGKSSWGEGKIRCCETQSKRPAPPDWSAPPIPVMTPQASSLCGDDRTRPRDAVRAPQVRRERQPLRAAIRVAAAARSVRRAQSAALRGSAADGVGAGAGAAERRVCGVAE